MRERRSVFLNDWVVVLVAMALGADAFSVALGMGMNPLITKNYIFWASSVVGAFHILMPLAGFYVGSLLGGLVGRVAVWIGGGILIILGSRMVWNGFPWRWEAYSFQKARYLWEKPLPSSLLGWGGLFALSWSVSVDSFGVGIGLGASMARISYVVLILGVVAGLMTAAGLVLGQIFTRWAGNWAKTLGGLVLAGTGLKMFF